MRQNEPGYESEPEWDWFLRMSQNEPDFENEAECARFLRMSQDDPGHLKIVIINFWKLSKMDMRQHPSFMVQNNKVDCCVFQ